jgi:A/G-specific adenine glycosylase
MLTGQALSRFRKNLLEWFAQFQRDLPWRRTKEPYRIWLSEIMLQQTRVAAVIPYYERFVERFPGVNTLADAPQEEVLRLWAGLGYYSRARNFQKAAQQIVVRHGGIFPSTREEALALPGIGSYTSAAILSIAYGKKLAVLESNVARVLARIGAIHGDLRAGNRWRQLQKTADAFLAPKSPGNWNQAMMELGATICSPRSPKCLLCPVNDFCQARKLGLVDAIPEKRKKRATVEIALASFVLVDRKGHTLLLPPPKRKSAHTADVGALVSRMWHFPTVEVQGSTGGEWRQRFERAFLSGRKLRAIFKPLAKVRHSVTYRSLTVFPVRASVRQLPRLKGAKCLLLSDLASVPVSNLTRKVTRVAMSLADQK